MTQLALDIQAEVPVDNALLPVLRETAAAVLAHQQVTGEAALSILLTGDEQMRQLNRDYAGLDEPTDVLSFGMELDETMPEELAGYLGDIAISLEKAEQQAEKGGHSLTAELQLLTIHGLLHLLGYDHYHPEEKAAMWSAQQAILDKLALNITIPE